MQPDGKIIVAGASWNGGGNDFSLVRLNADGSLDGTFGGSPAPGKAILPVGSSDDKGYSVTLQADGKIIVAGTSLNGSTYDFSVMRLNANGALDITFGGNPTPGTTIIPVGSSGDDRGYGVTVQSDGKIIVAGYSFSGDFSLVRLNTDGSLDSTFGGSPAPGKAIIPVGSITDQGYSVTVQPDGKIIVAGTSYTAIDADFSTGDFSLVRLNADGSLDSTFGGSPAPGKVIIPVGSGYEEGRSVTLQPDGKIIVAGLSSNGTYDFSLVRLNADGSLDSTFGGNPAPGKAIIPVGSGDDMGYSVTVQRDGKIIVSGASANWVNDDFSLVRLNADGSLDTSFNGPAVNTLGGTVAYTEDAAAVALDNSVVIHDADLAALDGGAGNYAGASVTLARSGGANSEDVFSALGNLSFTAGDVILSGLIVGSVTNAAGTLTITFDSDATQARVNAVLSSIGYANSSGAPPASVVIGWSFSDGNVSAQGSGGSLAAAGSTTVNIAAVNDAPTVSQAIADQAASEDNAFSFQFAAGTFADVDGGTLTYSAALAGGSALPAWLTFNSGTRTFSGTPVNADVGTLNVTLTASDGNGAKVSDTFDIKVTNTNDAPTLNQAIADQAASEDSAFSFQFAAGTFADVDGDTLTYSAALTGGGALPAWLTFNSETRTFSGTPVNADVGTLSVTLTASDSSGATVSDTFDIKVANINDAPTLGQAIADQAASEDSAFSFQFAAGTFVDVDGDTLSYSATLAGGGALPGWLTFNSATRTFSGTPVNADVGTLDVTLTASDGNGAKVSDTFDIKVANTNDAPTLGQAIADQAVSEDSAFSFQFAASTFADVDGDTLSYSATLAGGGALPTWLTFNGTTRTFSGTPGNADVGTLSITLVASDGNATASDTFDIRVGNVNDAPTGAVTIAGTPGLGYVLTAVTAALADADGLGALHYTWLRNGAAIAGAPDAATYKAGLPDIGSTLSVRVNYTDAGGIAESVISAPTALVAAASPPPGMNRVVGGSSVDALSGSAGADWIDGGLGIDVMMGGAGDDFYRVDNAFDVVVEAFGAGTDTVISAAQSWTLWPNLENLVLSRPAAVTGTGNALNNLIVGNGAANNLYGLEGADTLKGVAGADLLDGGGGDDVLVGGTGRDTLVGGTGRDLFVFDVAPGTANADLIRDFSARDDTVQLMRGADFDALPGAGTLAAAAFASGPIARDADDRILYDRSNGNLFYDADGTGAIASVLIATLMGSPELTNQDFVVM